MEHLFTNRAVNTPKSFLREIMKATRQPNVISFAGGVPNPAFFPVEEITEASVQALAKDGPNVLQYNATEGYLPLREYIAQRYMTRYGMPVDPAEILIINGSQQGLDLVGKVFLDKGDQVVMEQPGYLGAIQSFSMYESTFLPVPLLDDGIDLAKLEQTLQENSPKLFYTVSNFQNPSGLTYSLEKRKAVADLLHQYQILLVEDDPYGELRFTDDEGMPSIRSYFREGGVLLGSFSKVVAPGMRMGWVCASPLIMDKLVLAKQAADLHSNYFAQCVLHQYLQDNNLDSRIDQIKAVYKTQRDAMLAMIDTHFPADISYVVPDGGMFLWLTLPEGMSAMELFEIARPLDVVFVPGESFFVDGSGQNSLRLSYSNTDTTTIEEGMIRLADAIAQMRQ